MASRGLSLLLSAFPPELAGLEREPPPGWEVACTGIGALTAAAATARLLETLRPVRTLFVGTCGAYDDRFKVGDLLSAATVVATSVEEVLGGAYRPPVETTRWEAGLRLPWPAHDVAVTPAITRTAEGARALATVAPVEHLELAGVMVACQAAGVPCGALLGVANPVGPDAQREWRGAHAQVSRRLVEALRASGVLAWSPADWEAARN